MGSTGSLRQPTMSRSDTLSASNREAILNAGINTTVGMMSYCDMRTSCGGYTCSNYSSQYISQIVLVHQKLQLQQINRVPGCLTACSHLDVSETKTQTQGLVQHHCIIISSCDHHTSHITLLPLLS